jgi:hypothetical protein
MQTTTIQSGLWLIAALFPVAGCGGAASPGATAGAEDPVAPTSLLLGSATESCAFGDSSTLFLPDGRFESTTRTPAGDGTYLGHMTDGRLDPGVVQQIFAGVGDAVRNIRLATWSPAANSLPQHLCGREVLVIGGSNDRQWVAGDAAAVEALDPWVDDLTDALRPAGTPAP